MKVRLELDVHPSEALRVASLVSALHNFVTVLSTYSAAPDPSPPLAAQPSSPNPSSPHSPALSETTSDSDRDSPPLSPTNASASSPPPTSDFPPSPIPSEPPRPPPSAAPSSYFPSPDVTLSSQALNSLIPTLGPPAPSDHSHTPPDSHQIPVKPQPQQPPGDTNKTSISVELQNLITASLAAPPSPTQHQSARPPSPPRPPLSVCKREKQAHRHTQRSRRSKCGSRPKKIDVLDRTADTPGNRNSHTSSGINGERHTSEELESSNSSRRGRRNNHETNLGTVRRKPPRTTRANGNAENSNSSSSSKSKGRQRPPFTPITSPRVIFEAVARDGISVKHAVSNLQGMLSRTSSPLSEKTLVSAAVAEMGTTASLAQHPHRGINIVRVFASLGDGYLAAFRNRFVIKATRQFAKKREVGCDVTEFLGYSDGLSALVHEKCISPDAAMKTISRLLLKEGHWSAAITTLCKMAEMSNGELANNCRDREQLRNIKGRLADLAQEKQFAYDISYLNNTLNWSIPVAKDSP